MTYVIWECCLLFENTGCPIKQTDQASKVPSFSILLLLNQFYLVDKLGPNRYVVKWQSSGYYKTNGNFVGICLCILYGNEFLKAVGNSITIISLINSYILNANTCLLFMQFQTIAVNFEKRLQFGISEKRQNVKKADRLWTKPKTVISFQWLWTRSFLIRFEFIVTERLNYSNFSEIMLLMKICLHKGVKMRAFRDIP